MCVRMKGFKDSDSIMADRSQGTDRINETASQLISHKWRCHGSGGSDPFGRVLGGRALNVPVSALFKRASVYHPSLATIPDTSRKFKHETPCNET